MDQRPNNYNDQGPNGQGPNGNGGPGGQMCIRDRHLYVI